MKYKTIINRNGKKIDLHICQTQDGSYIIGIPDGLKDNAEMFVETYNSGGRQADTYSQNVQHAIDVFAYNENAIKFYNRNGYHPRMFTDIKKIK